jgi:hypothetical protein
MPTDTTCPSPEDLLEPVPEEAEAVERHLASCPRCRALRALALQVPPRRWRPRWDEWSAELPPASLGRALLVMPEQVRTGDIWQVVGQEARERYVAVVAGLVGGTRPIFTIAGTSPDVAFAGPGDVVVSPGARGVRVGYEFMLCTWSFAGVEERQFEQYLGRVGAAARRALLAGHRKPQPLDQPVTRGADREEIDPARAFRASFRARLNARLEADLIRVDPRDAMLPIRPDTVLDRRPPAWLTAVTSRFTPGDLPPPFEVARILRLEGVRWLPSTKRNVKWLFRTHAPEWWGPQVELGKEYLFLDPARLPELPEELERPSDEAARRRLDPERARERAAESYAREVEQDLEDWLR